MVPRDVRSGDPVYAHLRVEYAGNELFDPPNVSLVTRAPFVLPELKYITEVTLMDDRYHGFSFKVGRNWDELQVKPQTGLYLLYLPPELLDRQDIYRKNCLLDIVTAPAHSASCLRFERASLPSSN